MCAFPKLLKIAKSKAASGGPQARPKRACGPALRTPSGLPPGPWWSQGGSNSRPPACKAGALPAELWPRSGRGRRLRAAAPRLVGPGGFEPPTSPLSGVRSSHLSYGPGSLQTGRTMCCGRSRRPAVLKGGDPAAGSPTATLLRLHPSHEPHRGERPPFG